MNIQLRPHHQIYLDRFVEACRSDERVTAALMVGSYVKGRDDDHSDLDLYLFTTEDGYDEFASKRESFTRLLGEPSFMEDFGIAGIVFLIFPDGAEIEISYARERDIPHVLSEPYQVLVDKKNIIASILPLERQVDTDKQEEKLRRSIFWFWHELSHFITAMGRGHLWWAQGQLGALRTLCMNLARLQNDFSDTDAGDEGFFKIDNVLSDGQLSALKESFCPLERDAMLQAGFVILQFYKDRARPLAQAHGIEYPQALEDAMTERLKSLR
jgi:predicted nucleotidyltransferase